MSHRILVLEGITERGAEILKSEGFSLDMEKALPPAELVKLVPPYDAILVRSGSQMNAEVIDAAKSLKVIGRAGVGVDNVDLAAATRRGVLVMNSPGGNTLSTAELAVALMLALARNIAPADAAMKGEKWDRKSFAGVELYGKRLGVIGFGRIGRNTARICHQGFRMPILYHDVVAAPPDVEAESQAKRMGLEGLLRTADYVSLNLPLLPETRHIIGREQIRMMKPTAYLLNLGRGPLWDETAVLEALEQQWIAGAGTDVFEEEPTAKDNPLFRHRRFVCTPHMAAHTDEAMRRMSLVAEDVMAVLEGKEPRWPANRPKR